MINMDRIPENSVPSQFHPSLATSPVFLGEEEATTCLLLSSPSPTPLDYSHPLEDAQMATTFMGIPEIINDREEGPSADDPLGGDSSSSADSNSVVHDPVSAQLINNISMMDYQHLSKTGDLILSQDEDCKLNGVTQSTKKKLPEFVNWNWNIIRKVFLWVVLSGLFACCAVVVGLMVTLPKSCDPDIPWYQGTVFYEVFPASFQDSNNDGIGDFKGLISRIDYIHNLGISAVRLNSIFKAPHYPEQYYNIASLYDIDPALGSLADFKNMNAELERKNISLILDLPIYPLITRLSEIKGNATQPANDGDVGTILKYWISQGVDGFYLKGLENLVNDPNFPDSVFQWKRILGYNRPLIISEDVTLAMRPNIFDKTIESFDLVDVYIDASNGTENVRKDIHDVINGLFWSKPGYPWVHWSFGGLHTKRLSSKVSRNISLALTMAEMMLPGTTSIFYGDEINLEGVTDAEEDFHESKHIHSLTPMMWAQKRIQSDGILPWISTPGQKELPYDFVEIISKLAQLRVNSPTVYMNGIWKEGRNIPNTQISTSGKDILIIERWYPRRNSFVLVTNIGEESVTRDLSSQFYGGSVMVSSDSTLDDKVVYFGGIQLDPGVVVVIKLEK